MSIKKLAIYGSRRQQLHVDEIRRLLRLLVLDGVEVFIHPKFYTHLGELGINASGIMPTRDEFPADVDLVLSIGGDGTFLRTAAWVGETSVPILGINTGHLGYLSAMSFDALLTGLEDVLEGKFVTESRTLLEVVSPRVKGLRYALNEVAIAKEDTASMISADTYIDSCQLAEYKADGLIVATPTGSTAYNLSVGGPIIQPTAPVWVISPIAAHSLSLRPIVISDDAELKIQVSGRANTFRLSLDGRSTTLPIDTCVTIKRAPYRVEIVQQPGSEFPEVLQHKLMFN